MFLVFWFYQKHILIGGDDDFVQECCKQGERSVVQSANNSDSVCGIHLIRGIELSKNGSEVSECVDSESVASVSHSCYYILLRCVLNSS